MKYTNKVKIFFEFNEISIGRFFKIENKKEFYLKISSKEAFCLDYDEIMPIQDDASCQIIDYELTLK